MNDLESDEELVETPLVSPFPHSDDSEVLSELMEYENVGMLRREKAINSFDGGDLAFQCMIGFRTFVAYFDPFLPMNIITRKAYNTIMAASPTSLTFVVFEDIGEFIQINKAEVVMGKPFRKITKLEYDYAKRLMSFNKVFDNYTFQMGCTIPRNCYLEANTIFLEARLLADSELPCLQKYLGLIISPNVWSSNFCGEILNLASLDLLRLLCR
ncbi:hypothetical protein Tco_0752804 [Tanacetum coccineum]|uniref:Uncharacterized protein n=1 Tax=Tanacetum coccineum TaxID=301880 RepID=A0ABQ4Z7W9_9ASTR